MRKSTLMAAAMLAMTAGFMPAIPSRRRSEEVVTERRKKAQKSLKKSGRAPVSIAEREIIDAAEAKRERKAAKAERDMQRMKQGAAR